LFLFLAASLALVTTNASALEMTERQVRLDASLTMKSAQTVADKLFKLDAEGTEPILLIISTREGFAPAAMVVADAIRALRSKVYAVIQSEAFGPGAVVALFCHKRFAFPHAAILFKKLEYADKKVMEKTPPLPVAAAQKYLDHIYSILAKKTRMSLKKFKEKSDKGWYLTAAEAKKHGLIDEVVNRVDWVELVIETIEIKRSSTVKEKRPLPSAK
jgi:ATP-dependent Clp protease protease subunit